MYRFLKLRNISTCNSYIMSKQTNMFVSPQVCSFCNFYHWKIIEPLDVIQFRHVSTTSNTALLRASVKKKIKRRIKKYAELLEVTDTSTSNKRAAVQKLDSLHLSILVDQEIPLDQLHKIKSHSFKKITHNNNCVKEHESTVQNKISLHSQKQDNEMSENMDTKSSSLDLIIEESDMGIIRDMKESGISDDIDVLKSSLMLQSLEDKIEIPATDTKTKKRRKNSKQKSESFTKETPNEDIFNFLLKRERQENFNRTLLAYIDVCVNNDMVDHAHDCLMQFRMKKSKKRASLKDISAYNILLNKYASMGNLKKIKELLQAAMEDSLSVTPQTYAAVFECFGRLDKCSKMKELLNMVVKEMEDKNITLNEIIDKSVFVRDQQEKVLKAIKIIQPNFEPHYNKPKVSYSCNLLHQLTCTNNALVSPAEGLLTQEELKQRINVQLRNEIDGDVIVKSVEQVDSCNKKVQDSREKIQKLEKFWRERAMYSFERNLHILKKRENFGGYNFSNLHPYLTILNSEHYVNAIMREVKRLAEGSDGFSPPFSYLCRDLGSYIYKKYETSIKITTGVTDKVVKIHSDFCDWYISRADGYNNRAKWQLLAYEAKKEGVSLVTVVPQWPAVVLRNIGRFLYDIILHDLKINSNYVKLKNKNEIPAFYVVYKSKSLVELKQEVKSHMSITKLYRDSKPETLNFDANLVPSLCPPRPWLSVHSGGYLTIKSDIVRVSPNACQVWDRLLETEEKQLYPVLDSLNQLGSIPWKINTTILDLAIKIFRDGGNAKLDVPESPSRLSPLPIIKKDATPEEKVMIYKTKMDIKKKKNEMQSLWCDALYKLSLANHYRDEIFWLPHNMDFRGRVYPMPPHLTHVSSDLARSILMFAVGKPLGPNGLDWLKIHTINLTGLKKRTSVKDRLHYANEILDKIIDSADNPLTGEMWWTKSDEPWQTLAACNEIAAALKSPNPAEYVSRLPIHQDGSCNGLQHYAALGRDVIGAESVNLRPNDLPQDVYNTVAALVEKQREIDANNDIEVAKSLENFIKRKVIKQTVMTTVYGVTKYGARLQIARQLKDIDSFPQQHVWSASLYLVQKTFESLRTMFKSAREIQDWFTECARLISQIRGQNMEWVTPLGLPIVQPYTKPYKVKSPSSGPQTLFPVDIYEKPNIMKQKNAFPPNFIHSLDSTHMMLTSLHCEHHGITFVSVHDCFWTHSCTVANMNKICREQFVSLHSEPILEDLSKFLLSKYSYTESDLVHTKPQFLKDKKRLNQILSEVPEKGEFDLREVLSSVYFFS